MRISDWSSDVCSSDLTALVEHLDPMPHLQIVAGSQGPVCEIGHRLRVLRVSFQVARHQLPCRHVLQINRSAKRRVVVALGGVARSEEHTSELQSLMRISYAVFCLKKKKKTIKQTN